jgi:hypothetical protein
MPHRFTRTHRPAGIITSSSLLVSFLLGAFAAPASALALPLASPDGQILVVTANLREAWTPGDDDETTDMQIFAARLLAQTPYAPDALLLQEVTQTAAENVATILSTKTGMSYTAAVSSSTLRYETAERRYKFGNAIVLNSSTMAQLDAGGFIPTSYKRADGASGDTPYVDETAYTLAGETSGGLELSLASSHLAHQSDLKTEALADAYKGKWATKIADKLKSSYGVTSTRISSMGGDYNSGRCPGDMPPCDPVPFWRKLTSDVYGYRDAIRTAGGVGGVDFVFTTGGIYDADADWTYPKDAKEGDPGFYSDHRFRWALIGGDVTPPTAPRNVQGATGNVAIALSWTDSTDDRSGIDHYEIWRSGASVWDPHVIGTTSLIKYLDSNVYRKKSYRYFIVAVDGSHNRATSDTVTIQSL